MPDAPATPPTPQQKQDRAAFLALVSAFSLGILGFGLVLAVEDALGRLVPRPPMNVTTFVANLASQSEVVATVPSIVAREGPCQRHEAKMAPRWRALYTLMAVERLTAAKDLGKAEHLERYYFTLQVAAEARRMRSAALVDVAAALTADRRPEGPVPLLNWRAVIDTRTTPECRAANGKNFRADRMPDIGWPGSVHRACRCTCGPEVPGAPLLPSS